MNACLIGGGKKEPILREVLEDLPEVPRVLLVPTACSTPNGYERKVAATRDLFERLGATVDVLHDYGTAPTPTEMADKFGTCNTIFGLGGNSPYFMEMIDQYGIEQPLRETIAENKLVTGVSAGALAVFAEAHICPATNPAEETWDFEMLPMLNIIKTAAAVHANKIEPTKSVTRLEDFMQRLPSTGYDIGFAIDNGAAMVLGENSRILRSDTTANVSVVNVVGDMAMSRFIEDATDLQTLMRSVQA